MFKIPPDSVPTTCSNIYPAPHSCHPRVPADLNCSRIQGSDPRKATAPASPFLPLGVISLGDLWASMGQEQTSQPEKQASHNMTEEKNERKWMGCRPLTSCFCKVDDLPHWTTWTSNIFRGCFFIQPQWRSFKRGDSYHCLVSSWEQSCAALTQRRMGLRLGGFYTELWVNHGGQLSTTQPKPPAAKWKSAANRWRLYWVKLCILLFMAVGRQSLASEVIMSPMQEKLQNARLAQLRNKKMHPRLRQHGIKGGKHWEDDIIVQITLGKKLKKMFASINFPIITHFKEEATN